MKISWKLSFILGFSSAVIACSLYWWLDDLFYFIMQDKFNNITGKRIPDGKVDYSTYYKLSTFASVCYLHTVFTLVKKYIRNIFWIVTTFITFLIACNALVDELFFNPTLINLNEYIGTGIIISVAVLFKKKWTT